jgi:hypothetical protein
MNAAVSIVLLAAVLGVIVFLLSRRENTRRSQYGPAGLSEFRTDLPLDECFDRLDDHSDADEFVYECRRENDGGFLTVRGEKSKIVQQHARKIVTEMQKREKVAKGKGKDVDLSIEELEDLSVDRAVVRIISWRGISEDGEDIPFTKENAARILKEHSWIKEAVFENSDELLNFRN